MHRLYRGLLRTWYKLGTFGFTVMTASTYLESVNYELIPVIFMAILGSGFYMAVVELIDKFCPIEK